MLVLFARVVFCVVASDHSVTIDENFENLSFEPLLRFVRVGESYTFSPPVDHTCTLVWGSDCSSPSEVDDPRIAHVCCLASSGNDVVSSKVDVVATPTDAAGLSYTRQASGWLEFYVYGDVDGDPRKSLVVSNASTAFWHSVEISLLLLPVTAECARRSLFF